MYGSRGGDRGSGHPPPEKSQKIGFLSNSGPDPLKNCEASDHVPPIVCGGSVLVFVLVFISLSFLVLQSSLRDGGIS